MSKNLGQGSLQSNSSSTGIQAIVSRAINGDAEAVHQLIRDFASVIARELRTQRRFQSLQSRVDSDDISQSVWRCFFSAVVGGEVVFQQPNDVAAYLGRVARNKIESQFRTHLAKKRDIRKTVSSSQEFDFHVSTDESPSEIISTFDFVQSVLSKMSEEEKRIVQRRAQGATWDELAKELATRGDTMRKRHAKVAARILKELDVDDKTT